MTIEFSGNIALRFTITSYCYSTIRFLIQIPKNEKVHTLTLYLNPARQKALYEEIINLNPERIIFNPGTENEELYDLAKNKGIAVQEACTLVLLSTGQY